MKKSPDFLKITRQCIEMTRDITGRYRSRLAGSADCAASAMELFDGMNDFCDSAELHRFAVYPGQFYAYTKILPVFYMLGLALAFFPGPYLIVPLIGVTAGCALMFSQFGFYLHLFDRFFPRREGVNVIGTVEPAKRAIRQVIVSGHHDSAPVTRFLMGKMQRVLIVTMTLPYLFFFFQIAVLAIWFAAGRGAVPAWQKWTLIAGVPSVAAYFFAVDTDKGTPGAGDNMIASVIALCLGKELSSKAWRGGGRLRNTRIVLASFDAEEAGLRGASAYFRERGRELSRIPTFHLNLDSLYNLKELQVLESEINGFLKLPDTVTGEVAAIAGELGIPIRRFRMVFGGGATDAAESARAGIPSTTIIALPTTVVREGMVYHTPHDTADHIEPDVVTACLKIVWEYVKRIDERELTA